MLCFASPHPQRSQVQMRGFTLIEVMVVVVIIGILAGLLVPKLMGRADDAKIVAAKHDIQAIGQALKMYRLDNSRYPTTEQGLAALTTRPDKAPLPSNWRSTLEQLPLDPWGHPYVYLSPGLHGDYDVLSYGADGVAGGEGVDADIGSWQVQPGAAPAQP